ncbi:MAG: MopE-related protein [Chitinophagales bacterium]
MMNTYSAVGKFRATCIFILTIVFTCCTVKTYSKNIESTNLTLQYWYADADSDGYGNNAVSVFAETPPSGYVADNTDCNDSNAAIHPGVSEVCNGLDDDCDGSTDEGVLITFYYDNDGDSFGDGGVSIQACSAPSGYVANALDCNDFALQYSDNDGDGYGSNTLVPCGLYNNSDCDDTQFLYYDLDGDGFGAPSPAPCGVTNNSDCNDFQLLYVDGDGDGFGSSVFAPCYGSTITGDCNDAQLQFEDLDGDGFGNGSIFAACGVTTAGDCNDNLLLYVDADNDGYGTTTPAGCGANNTNDCNDANYFVNPGRTEACNSIDDNCNGTTDEGTYTYPGGVNFYSQADVNAWQPCYTTINGYILISGSDITDLSPLNNITEITGSVNINYNPNLTSINGFSSLVSSGGSVFISSNDNLTSISGFQNMTSSGGVNIQLNPVLETISGFNAMTLSSSDFNIVSNQALETISGFNSLTTVNGTFSNAGNFALTSMDGFAALTTVNGTFSVYYNTSLPDMDAFNNLNSVSSIFQLQFNFLLTDACGISDLLTTPGAIDGFVSIVNNGIGANSAAEIISYCSDADEDGYSIVDGDCDDANNLISPDGTEICNALDDDCDGTTDEGLSTFTYYLDLDEDGFGDNLNTGASCFASPPSGFSSDNTDCNDANNSVHPGATELCDGLDNDCDGIFDENTITATISPSGLLSVCKGNNMILNANNGEGYSYQWKRNGANIAGATNQNYSATKAGNYSVVVTIPGGCADLSENVSLSILAAPTASVTNQDATNDLCFDTSIKLKANGGAGTSWQWYKNGNPISGQTNIVYYATTPGNYKVQVTALATGCSKLSASYPIAKSCRESESNFDGSSFVIYPNPASNQFMIELNSGSTATSANIQLFNIVGEEIYSTTVSANAGVIDENISLNNQIPAGLYIVKIIIGDLEFTKQLIIQN